MTTTLSGLSVADGTSAGRGAQPRQLIVTVYGLHSRAEGGWLSVASLVSLLAELGIDEQAIRSSISRLKRRGIVHAERRHGSAGYALSSEAIAILREGDTHIFRRERATLADGWVLAVFSVPEAERNKRHVLRSQLTRLGFGTAAPGVWIAPAHLRDPAQEMLRSLGLADNTELFTAQHFAFGDLREKVAQWWDLQELERLYGAFLELHSPIRKRWRRRRQLEPVEAFTDYVQVLTDWRQLPYLDPGLPAELLPRNWVGIRAADLFFEVREQLEEHARAHISATIA